MASTAPPAPPPKIREWSHVLRHPNARAELTDPRGLHHQTPVLADRLFYLLTHASAFRDYLGLALCPRKKRRIPGDNRTSASPALVASTTDGIVSLG